MTNQSDAQVPSVDVPVEVSVQKKKRRKSPGIITQTEIVTLRMTVEQKADLVKKSDLAEKSINLFVLDAIQSAKVMPKARRNKDLQDLNAWLGRLNSNINMISKHANIYKENADAVIIHVRLAQIRQDLQKLVDGVLK